MEETNVDGIGAHLKEYLQTQYEILKLQLVGKLSLSGAWIVSVIIICLIFFISILFLSVGAAIYLSGVLGSYPAGFGLVGAIYLVVGVIALVAKQRILVAPLRDKIINASLNKADD
jgi:hypothetical protein